ncbi:hypothetical protein BGZ67_000445 [Mortierella alpina]|nr:hypothetical protein BGZ67_000445 [Mortierella alpina]
MATRIVSSTIVRPDIDSRVADSTSGRKRSLPGSPEPHRRQSRPSISSRLSSSNISNNKTDANATTTLTAETATAGSGTVGQTPQHSSVSETAAASGSGSGSGSLEAGNSNSNADAMEDSEVQDKKGTEDRTQRNNKRPRLALNPAEDAKRGRRMMGMILGTLGQFKKQQQQQQVPDLGSTAGSGVGRDAPVASGVASREAVQKRVQEKLRRERELNEELRKKEVEERRARMEKAEAQRRRDPPSAPAPRGAAAKRRRNEVQWENGYILTETRPRLRYMPKILNDTTRKRLQERTKDADDKKDTSSAFSKAELNEDAITMEAGMDLDGEDMVVDQEVVMDVKEKEEEEEEEGKDGDKDNKETTKTTGEDDHASKTPISGSALESLTTTTTTSTSSRTVNDDDNDVSDDVDMSVAARDVESDQVKGSSPAEDTATKTSTEETAGSDDNRVKPDLINISLV